MTEATPATLTDESFDELVLVLLEVHTSTPMDRRDLERLKSFDELLRTPRWRPSLLDRNRLLEISRKYSPAMTA